MQTKKAFKSYIYKNNWLQEINQPVNRLLKELPLSARLEKFTLGKTSGSRCLSKLVYFIEIILPQSLREV